MFANRRLVIILVSFIALCSIYVFLTPPWESSDEWAHVDFVVFIKDEQRLPTHAEIYDDPTRQLKQLPAYYIVSSLFISPFDTDGFAEPEINPWLWTPGSGLNWALPTKIDPLHNTAQAMLYVLRLTSIMWGTIALVLVYHTVRLIFPSEKLALFTVLLMAFQPRFIVTSSMVNNDVFVMLWSTMVIYFATRLMLRPFHFLTLGAMGFATFMALLSKSNAIALLPFPALILLWLMVRRLRRLNVKPLHIAGILGLGFVGTVGVLATYLVFALDANGRPEPNLPSFSEMLDRYTRPTTLRWDRILPAFEHAYLGYWGQFGFETIELPRLWLFIIGIISIAALSGFVTLWRRTSADNQWLLLSLGLLFASFCAIPIIFVLDAGYIYLFHGRYLMPSVAAVMIMLAFGWSELHQRFRLAPQLYYAPVVALFLLSFMIPFTLIIPAYLPPQPIADIPAGYSQVDLRFGDTMHLIAYDVDTDLELGSTVVVHTCWEVLGEIAGNYTVEVVLLDAQLERLSSGKSIPGNGNYPTSNWQPNTRFCDAYYLPVSNPREYPTLGFISMSVYEYLPRQEAISDTLIAYDQANNEFQTPILTTVRINGTRPRQFDDQADLGVDCTQLAAANRYYFPDERLRLTLARIERTSSELVFVLCWEAEQAIDRDLRLLVHVLNSDDEIIAQGDRTPLVDDYPIMMWEQGDQLQEHHVVSIPTEWAEADLSLLLGLYEANGGRLSVESTDGTLSEVIRLSLLR